MTPKAAIQAFLESLVAPEPVVFANQNAPAVALPYWTVQVTTTSAPGDDTLAQGVNAQGEQLVAGVREATVVINRFGEGSLDAVATLRDRMRLTTVGDMLRSRKLACYRVSKCRDLTALVDESRYKERAELELFIRHGVETLDNVGIIETVKVDSTFI